MIQMSEESYCGQSHTHRRWNTVKSGEARKNLSSSRRISNSPRASTISSFFADPGSIRYDESFAVLHCALSRIYVLVNKMAKYERVPKVTGFFVLIYSVTSTHRHT